MVDARRDCDEDYEIIAASTSSASVSVPDEQRPSASPAATDELDDGSGEDDSPKAGKHEPTWPRDMLQLIYRKLDHKGGLMWMNREGDTPMSRVRDEREIELRRKHVEKLHKNYGRVSEGYGEMTFGSITKLFEYLQGLGEWARIGKDSTFIDIGSGFGKVVFHAKLQCGVKVAHGIEYVTVRVQAADEIKAEFFPDGGRSRELEFDLADATTRANYDYTHIYMYDRIFYEDTYVKLCPKLEASSFRILVSYREPSFLHKHGLIHIDLIHKMSLRSTGKQNFTAYIYRKRLASRKAIAAAKAAWLEQHRPATPPPRVVRRPRNTGVPAANRIRAADILSRARQRPVVHAAVHASASAGSGAPLRRGFSVAAAASEARRRAQLAAAAAARRAQAAAATRRAQAAAARARAAAAAARGKGTAPKPTNKRPRALELMARRRQRLRAGPAEGRELEEWERRPRRGFGSRLERLALDAAAGGLPTAGDVAAVAGRTPADFLLWELFSTPSALAAALARPPPAARAPTGASWADPIPIHGEGSASEGEERGAAPGPLFARGFGPARLAPPAVRPRAGPGPGRGGARGAGGGWESGESSDEEMPAGLVAFHDWGEEPGPARPEPPVPPPRLPPALHRALWPELQPGGVPPWDRLRPRR